jgi:hypothetical protein
MNYVSTYVPGSNTRKDAATNQEITRLLSAAVINHKFCKLLLTNPAAALKAGFNGESFAFSPLEQEQISSIRATTLQSFVEQLVTTPVHDYAKHSRSERVVA